MLAVRLALPIVLAPMIADTLSRTLGAKVEVGDVTFAPIDAILSLHDVQVRTAGQLDASEPAVSAQRVLVDLQWLPMLHDTLLVRELGLESASIDLERLAAGGITLETLSSANPAREVAPGWSFEIDRVVLRDALVRLPGALQGGSEAVEIGLREAQFATRKRRASAFGRAPNLRIDALLQGGRIRVDGSTDVRDNGVVVNALVRAKDVPLARLSPWLPDLGTTALSGIVSGQLHYQRDPGRRERASGKLHVRRLALHVPSLDEPALAVRRAEVDVDRVDLKSKRVVLESVQLFGARLAARADLANPLPLFASAEEDDGQPRRTPATTRVPVRPQPWSWRIGRLEAARAEVRVPGANGVTVLPATLSADDVGPLAYWSPVRATLRYGEVVAAFDGTTQFSRRLSIVGRLNAAGIDVPSFARAAGVSWADMVQAGRAAADLEVEIEPGAKEAPPVGVKGTIRVAGLWVAAPEPSVFALGADGLDLKLKHVLPPNGRGRKGRGAEVAFSDATVRAPYVQLTRANEQWLLPPFPDELPLDPLTGFPVSLVVAMTSPPPSPVTPEAFATVPAATPVAAATASAPEDTGPPTEVVLGGLRTIGGRLIVVDLTTTPASRFDWRLVEGWARNVRFPSARVGEFVVHARDRGIGVVQVGGVESGGGMELQASGQSLQLASFAPYLEHAGLPYPFIDGTASFVANAWLTAGRWTADATLTLDQPRLAVESAELRRQIGMPFASAVNQLRDANGTVTLPLTLGSGAAAGAVPLSEQVANAIRQALVKARDPAPTAPVQIAFYAGRDEPTPGALRQIETLATLMERRPDLAIELTAPLSEDDRHWIAEQEVGPDIVEESSGFMGVLRVFGVKGTAQRIREALAQRARGEPGHLDEEDEATLDRLVREGPPIPDDRLRALGATRLARTAELLARAGVPRHRVVIAGATSDSTTTPGVRARVGIAVRASQFQRSSSPRVRRRRRPSRRVRRRVRRRRTVPGATSC